MSAVDEYGGRLLEGLDAALRQGNRDLEAAGQAIAASVRAGGAVHVFGSGHSQLVALDAAGRAGSLPAIRALVDERLSPTAGQDGAAMEQDAGQASALLRTAGLAPADALVVVSHSGVNPLPVELAREATSRGHTVIAVTSRTHASGVPARHDSGRRLHDIAEVTLDTRAPLGDAAVELRSGDRAGPTSTVLAAALLTAAIARAAELLCADGSPGGAEPGSGAGVGDARATAPIPSRNLPPAGERLAADLLISEVTLPSLYPGGGRGWLAAAGGRIVGHGLGRPRARAEREASGGGGALLPGFVDVHVHGAEGHDTMAADPEGLRAIARFHARHGVTALLPTTWAAPPAETAAAVRAVAETRGPVAGGATILGAHLEGPWLARRRCGAQDPAAIREADPAEVATLLDTGAVRLVTVAPEIPANRVVLDACRRRGITCSVGHTDGDHAAAAAAVAAGARHATHCFNAMRGFDHRRPGIVGAVLSDPSVRCELVADNVHVHPLAMRLLLEAKGPEGVVLVSDAVEVTGLPEGRYTRGAQTVEVADGAVRLPDGSLAGSVLTLDAALRNLSHATGRPLSALWRTTSLNAALAAGVGDRKGHLGVGADADLVVLDRELGVRMTVVGGDVVHDAREVPT